MFLIVLHILIVTRGLSRSLDEMVEREMQLECKPNLLVIHNLIYLGKSQGDGCRGVPQLLLDAVAFLHLSPEKHYPPTQMNF